MVGAPVLVAGAPPCSVLRIVVVRFARKRIMREESSV